VIIDEVGYTAGAKLADLLSSAGHHVEIVTRQYSLGEDIGTTLRAKLYERLLNQGVIITPLHEAIAVTSEGVRLRHMLTVAESDRMADTIIFSSGGYARDQLFHELTTLAPAIELHLIGDAYAPRNLRLAMADGARVGRAI
jgi:pyruvate/2-oxoglutarate dehydrogenase complex dihydrolipoamide dehydrogenase (E3) component